MFPVLSLDDGILDYFKYLFSFAAFSRMNMYSAFISMHYSCNKNPSRANHVFSPWVYKIRDHLSKEDTHGSKPSKSALIQWDNLFSRWYFMSQLLPRNDFPGKSRAPALFCAVPASVSCGGKLLFTLHLRLFAIQIPS